MKPKRIQRKRTKGWKMPEGAVYVGRPTKWGNPYEVTSDGQGGFLVAISDNGAIMSAPFSTYEDAANSAIKYFRQYLNFNIRLRNSLGELRGKDLACWCPLDQPCHADVLLELANKEAPM